MHREENDANKRFLMSSCRRRTYVSTHSDLKLKITFGNCKDNVQGRNPRNFLGEEEPMGGHNLTSLVEIELTYLKIWVRQLPCLPYR